MYPLQVPDVARALGNLYGIKGKLQFSLGATVQPVVIVASTEEESTDIKEVSSFITVAGVAAEAAFFILEPVALGNLADELLVRSLTVAAAATALCYWACVPTAQYPGSAQVNRGRYKATALRNVQTTTRSETAVNALDEGEWMGVIRLTADFPQMIHFNPAITVPRGGQFVAMLSTPNVSFYASAEFAEVPIVVG